MQTSIPVDTSTLVQTVAALALPALIAWLKSNRATSAYSAALTWAVCLLFTLANTVIAGAFVAGDAGTPLALARLLLVNLAVLVIGTYTMYATVYRPSGAADALERRGPQLGG